MLLIELRLKFLCITSFFKQKVQSFSIKGLECFVQAGIEIQNTLETLKK